MAEYINSVGLFFNFDFILFYGCFAYMHICGTLCLVQCVFVREVLGLLELELEMLVSHLGSGRRAASVLTC